jgi:CBS domain-containing protein
MQPDTKPLLSLTAADLMSRNVVTLPPDMSLRAAARLLSETGVSGAPVIDAQGRCIGVLSAIDFVLWAREQKHVEQPCHLEHHFVTPWQVVDLESLPADQVRNYMTTDLVTASPSARIGDLARQMADARVRRVIIVDEQGRPLGVVSSTDIMSTVAEADRKTIEEAGRSASAL